MNGGTQTGPHRKGESPNCSSVFSFKVQETFRQSQFFSSELKPRVFCQRPCWPSKQTSSLVLLSYKPPFTVVLNSWAFPGLWPQSRPSAVCTCRVEMEGGLGSRGSPAAHAVGIPQLLPFRLAWLRAAETGVLPWSQEAPGRRGSGTGWAPWSVRG